MSTCKLLDIAKQYCPDAKFMFVHPLKFWKSSKRFIPIKKKIVDFIEKYSPYAISKSGADLIASFYAEAYNMKILITRMFTHTGPRRGDIFAESTFAKQIALIEAKQIEPIIKVGNLNSLRTVADVRDAVRAYYMLLTINPQYGETYNIGGDYTCKISDILDYLIEISELEKKNVKILEDPERIREIDADLQIPDTNKFKKHTGWKPEIPFGKTMLDLLNFGG